MNINEFEVDEGSKDGIDASLNLVGYQ